MSYKIDNQLAEQITRLQPALASLPDFTPGNPLEWRNRANALYRLINQQFPEYEGIRTQDIHLPLPDKQLMARRYSPENRLTRGIVLYIHGGGGVAGSVSLYDKIVGNYVSQSRVEFLSLEYGLSPETSGLAQTEQVIAALHWLRENSAQLDIDPSRIVLMGDSGGGGIVASAALLALTHSITLAGLVMVYPMLNHQVAEITPELASLLSISTDEIETAWRARLGNDVDKTALPFVSPSAATSLAGLPPTFIDVGELDLFCQECFDWASRSVAAGIPTEFHLYSGVNHGFELLAPLSEKARMAFELRSQAIQRMAGQA